MAKWMRQACAALGGLAPERYGDMWTLQLLGGNTTFVFVSDPELMESFFTADPDVLRAGAAHQRIGTALLGEGSLLLLDEPDHMEISKTLLMPPFKSDHVKHYRQGIARVRGGVADWPLHEPLELLPRMERIALSMIMSTIFGVTQRARQESLRARIRTLSPGEAIACTWAASRQPRGAGSLRGRSSG